MPKIYYCSKCNYFPKGFANQGKLGNHVMRIHPDGKNSSSTMYTGYRKSKKIKLEHTNNALNDNSIMGDNNNDTSNINIEEDSNNDASKIY